METEQVEMALSAQMELLEPKEWEWIKTRK